MSSNWSTLKTTVNRPIKTSPLQMTVRYPCLSLAVQCLFENHGSNIRTFFRPNFDLNLAYGWSLDLKQWLICRLELRSYLTLWLQWQSTCLKEKWRLCSRHKSHAQRCGHRINSIEARWCTWFMRLLTRAVLTSEFGSRSPSFFTCSNALLRLQSSSVLNVPS